MPCRSYKPMRWLTDSLTQRAAGSLFQLPQARLVIGPRLVVGSAGLVVVALRFQQLDQARRAFLVTVSSDLAKLLHLREILRVVEIQLAPRRQMRLVGFLDVGYRLQFGLFHQSFGGFDIRLR